MLTQTLTYVLTQAPPPGPTGIPTGGNFKDALLALAGNIFIIIFVVRCIGAFAKKEWGELIVNLLAAILVAGLVYATSDSINLLKIIWELFTGN